MLMSSTEISRFRIVDSSAIMSTKLLHFSLAFTGKGKVTIVCTLRN